MKKMTNEIFKKAIELKKEIEDRKQILLTLADTRPAVIYYYKGYGYEDTGYKFATPHQLKYEHIQVLKELIEKEIKKLEKEFEGL